MNCKRISGIIAIVIGCAMLAGGYYVKSEMKTARGDIDTTFKFVPKNPVKGAVKGRLYGEVDKYQIYATLLFIGSGVFIVGGGALVVFGRNKKTEQ
jgi:hypothetical protein